VLFGLPLVAVLLIFGNKYIVDVAFSIVAILAIEEYFHAFSKKANPVRWIGYVASAFIAVIHLISMKYVLLSIGMSTTILIAILFIQIIITNMKTNVNDIAITVLGICYIVRIYALYSSFTRTGER
jgi:signal transduction histidine kinase